MPPENASQMLEPTFVRDFQCIGERCPSNCCHSWSIALDKKSFKAMRKSSDSVIKTLSKRHFKRHEGDTPSPGAYGVIRLDGEGRCPMLDGAGLCEVHKRLGPGALSVTCQQYPRMPLYFGNRLELSLSLSCPAAAEAILYNPDAMMLSRVTESSGYRHHFAASGMTTARLPLWADLLRDYSFEVMLLPQYSLSEKLFILGLSYHQIDDHLADPMRVEQVLAQYRRHIQDGTMRKSFSALPELRGHRWKIFVHQVLNITGNIRKLQDSTVRLLPAEARFLDFQAPLIRQLSLRLGVEGEDLGSLSRALQASGDGVNVAEAFDDLLARARAEVINPYFSDHPQVLLNYLLYQLYHHQFLLGSDKRPIQFFQVMMVDLLVIEGYLAGLALEQGLDRERVIGLFSAYAKKRQHSRAFVDEVEQYLKRASPDPLAAVFGLLT
ncbi:flagellin lysine-N-methylase [Ferrimonas futtsuensis]|uniref:flagellin lysine-N-methylase n=1 Tax=Ferrimonas futtsuensis TaxID=364764 RepID=UPI000429A6DB|nr:flagellin lysine-N-methylase [Ferrimonas futtsuensis]